MNCKVPASRLRDTVLAVSNQRLFIKKSAPQEFLLGILWNMIEQRFPKLDMMWEWRAMANFKNFQLQIQILVTGRVCKWPATWVLALCMACRSLMLCTWARGLNLEIPWGLMGARPPRYRLEPHKVPMHCWLQVSCCFFVQKVAHIGDLPIQHLHLLGDF